MSCKRFIDRALDADEIFDQVLFESVLYLVVEIGSLSGLSGKRNADSIVKLPTGCSMAWTTVGAGYC